MKLSKTNRSYSNNISSKSSQMLQNILRNNKPEAKHEDKSNSLSLILQKIIR